MSGHNKWSKIKNVKAKNEAENSKLYTKIIREITVAVREGGADPNSNFKLKSIIAKAKTYNMPSDNINRVLKKNEKDLDNFDQITYEGYGPGGSAVMVEVLTDNKNRTASDVRHIFDKFGGNLATSGSVSYLFKRAGEIIILKGKGLTDDDIINHTLLSGADDAEIYDTYYYVVTSPENFYEVKKYFEGNNVEIEEANVNLVALNNIKLPEEKLASFEKLVAALEDNDDVQQVYHNVNLPDKPEEE